MKRKFKFLILGIGALLALVGILDLAAKSLSPSSSASLTDKASLRQKEKEDFPEDETSYSFYQDDDSDGLSNAKEIIYGSSPKIADTDGDGYLDGDEVAHGYDPLVAGSAKLKERENLSLTVRYFLWAQQEKGVPDPSLDDTWIEEFLKQTGAEEISLVSDSEMIISSEEGGEAIRDYLNSVNRIGIPEGMAGYETLAQNYGPENASLLQDLLDKIELALLDFKKIKTPREALEIQRDYLTVIKEFYRMFQDLRLAKEDPVRIKANIKKAQKLIELAQKAEELKIQLIQKYGIS